MEFDNWRKSTRSGSGTDCVEFASATDGTVGLRDSKNTDGPVLTVTPREWRVFMTGLKGGAFDR